MIDAPTLPTLVASRVKLRWLTDADVPALYAVFSHEEAMRYWSTPAMTELKQAQDYLDPIQAGFAEKNLFQWGIALLKTDEIIGTCTLHQLDARNRRAEIGFALNPAYWGQGYASEAVGRALQFAFGPLRLHRIEADTDPRNTASIAVLKRLGFAQEGHLRERWLTHGQAQDSALFGLLASDWRAMQTQGQAQGQRAQNAQNV
jgi:[ribosomal protein S5]-alanine N-acetyltransferase